MALSLVDFLVTLTRCDCCFLQSSAAFAGNPDLLVVCTNAAVGAGFESYARCLPLLSCVAEPEFVSTQLLRSQVA